jgi:hypothetical protein
MEVEEAEVKEKCIAPHAPVRIERSIECEELGTGDTSSIGAARESERQR